MKNLLLTLLCCLPLLAHSQEASSLQDELTGMLAYNEQAILSLAGVIPAEKYDWRPAEGVRSVGDVCLHVASANYFFMMNLGFALPEGVDLQNMESIAGKEKIVETVKNSFAFAKEKIKEIKTEDLEAKVKFPFGEFSKRTALLILLEHSGEHKGQLIAYSRMNGITPPWSDQ